MASANLYPLPLRAVGQEHAPRAGTAPAPGQAPPAFISPWIFWDPPCRLHPSVPCSSPPRATPSTVAGNTATRGRVCSPRRSRHRCRCCSARSSRSRPRRRSLSTARHKADVCSSPLRPAPGGLHPDAPTSPGPALAKHRARGPSSKVPGLIARSMGITRGARGTGASGGRAVG